MNDTCTSCGKKTSSITCATFKRRGSVTLQEHMMGIRRPRNQKGRPHGTYGVTFIGDGLCDDCAAKVIEYIRTMQDSMDKHR